MVFHTRAEAKLIANELAQMIKEYLASLPAGDTKDDLDNELKSGLGLKVIKLDDAQDIIEFEALFKSDGS